MGTLVIERALDLLECLSDGPASVEEISRQTGIPPSTVHRLIRPLVARNYILRERPGSYGLGFALADLSSGMDINSIIATMSRPIISNLAKACGRTAHLGLLHDNMVRYLVKVGGRRQPIASQEMSEFEAYCTGIGKAALSQLDPEQIETYLAEGEFVPLTATTISQRGSLKKELNGVRKRGWALDLGEFSAGIYCLAVPVQVQTGRIQAAVSITEFREDVEAETANTGLLECLPAVTRAAETISAMLNSRSFT